MRRDPGGLRRFPEIVGGDSQASTAFSAAARVIWCGSPDAKPCVMSRFGAQPNSKLNSECASVQLPAMSGFPLWSSSVALGPRERV